MESYELTILQEQFKKRQNALKEIDDKLAQQLTRQAVLEQLYGQSNISQSENSRSVLSESSISQGQTSNASISSQFLKKQIKNVHSYMRQINEHNPNQTHTKTKIISRSSKNQANYDEYKNQRQQKYNQLSSFFNKQAKDNDVTIKQVDYEQIRMKKQQKQSLRKRQMVEFLQAKQSIRLENLKQERLKIREQLLKQRNLKKQNIQQPRKIKQKTKIFDVNMISNTNTLKMQRDIALNRLLKEVQNCQKKTSQLIERTRFASFK